MKKSAQCSPEVMERAVRMVQVGQREGTTTAESERLEALERKIKELRKANEILRLASAFFALVEHERRFKS